jgi:hypothetical protein
LAAVWRRWIWRRLLNIPKKTEFMDKVITPEELLAS